MRKVFIHATMATLLSIAASLTICWLALAALGSRMDVFAAAMSTICPLVVAFPVSAYVYNQKRRVSDAHEALKAAHEELAAVHGQLEEKARRDDLTGLFNRSAFIAAVEATRHRDDRGTLLLIDADNFKRVNDGYGHLMGDMALCAMAEAIREAAGEANVSGRIGGEEFGVFLFGQGMEQATAAAEQVRSAVEALQFHPGQEPLRLTVSIGVAPAKKGDSFSTLMGRADKRLYAAKANGRNMVVAETQASAAA